MKGPLLFALLSTAGFAHAENPVAITCYNGENSAHADLVKDEFVMSEVSTSARKDIWKTLITKTDIRGGRDTLPPEILVTVTTGNGTLNAAFIDRVQEGGVKLGKGEFAALTESAESYVFDNCELKYE